MVVYTALNGLIALIVFISGGRIEPHEYDLKEYWSWKGGGCPPWYVRAIRDRVRRRRPHDEVDDGERVEDGTNSVGESNPASSTKGGQSVPID